MSYSMRKKVAKIFNNLGIQKYFEIPELLNVFETFFLTEEGISIFL